MISLTLTHQIPGSFTIALGRPAGAGPRRAAAHFKPAALNTPFSCFVSTSHRISHVSSLPKI